MPVKNFTPIEELPLLLSINCLMNVKIKQNQPIWETNFGKRLIYGSDFKENQGSLETGKLLQKATQENTNDLIKLRSNALGGKKNFFFLKKNSGLSKNGRETARDKVSSPLNLTPKKCRIKKAKHKMLEWTKKNALENRMNDCENSSKKPSMATSTFTITPSITSREDKENVESSYEPLRVPSFVKNQGLLTNCVKSILDNVSSENICEHCEKPFSHVNELIDHWKKHETEKETCLLCNKMFYTAEDFTKHLLTHEGVDKFSCKMCKKYFPTLKTFKKHYQEFHLVALKTLSQNDEEIRSQCLPRYECVRCKAEFSSKETHKNHRRIHQKMDLTTAYHLCDKNVQI